MRETEGQLATSCYQRTLPPQILSAILLGCWPWGCHANLQTTQDTVKTMDCSLQTDSEKTLLRKIPTQVGEHEESKMLPTQSLHSYILVILMQEDTLESNKREM